MTDFAYSEELVARYGQKLNILVTDSGRLVQMMSNESLKENAVQYILQTLGLTMSDALWLGDDYNDLGLFQS
ncbi:HAD hydrolase family protein [Paenibacillus tyrfis]|uniref:HAD hydrolase family protein n=1 Tax=Paenibacillus tyrfis TaxID=1501230 RepID=UPI000B58F1C4|nr:HAD hydrolase family protein [Paenibacillus tyrfis]